MIERETIAKAIDAAVKFVEFVLEAACEYEAVRLEAHHLRAAPLNGWEDIAWAARVGDCLRSGHARARAS